MKGEALFMIGIKIRPSMFIPIYPLWSNCSTDIIITQHWALEKVMHYFQEMNNHLLM